MQVATYKYQHASSDTHSISRRKALQLWRWGRGPEISPGKNRRRMISEMPSRSCRRTARRSTSRRSTTRSTKRTARRRTTGMDRCHLTPIPRGKGRCRSLDVSNLRGKGKWQPLVWQRTYRRRCVVCPSETVPRWHQWRRPRYGRLLPYIQTRSRSHSHHRCLQDSLDVRYYRNALIKLGEVGLVIFFKKKGSDLHVDTPCRP
jgi:hypothetical protein